MSKQIPLQKLSQKALVQLERHIADTYRRLKAAKKEKSAMMREHNEAIDGLREALDHAIRKLEDDLNAPTPEESKEDRETAEEIASRVVGGGDDEDKAIGK